MHIPDAVLDPKVLAATGLVAAGGVAYGSWALRGALRDRTPVLMGSMAAFVFAAQMVNFPLPFVPASGHLLGGVLAAVLLGPWAGALVIGAVLVVQCLLCGDGGLTALGANFVNMGLIGSVGGYAIYATVRRLIGGGAGVILGAMVAAWFSVILASGAFAVELAASGRGPGFLTVLEWMALVHSAIGLGEALITGTVLRFLLLVRPDLIPDPGPALVTGRGAQEIVGGVAGPIAAPGASRWGQVLIGGLAVSLAVAIFLAPFASEFDDGLEWVGAKLGFVREAPPVIPAPIPDYRLNIPGLSHPRLATALAGAIGTLVVFGVGVGLARGLSARDSSPWPKANGPEP